MARIDDNEQGVLKLQVSLVMLVNHLRNVRDGYIVEIPSGILDDLERMILARPLPAEPPPPLPPKNHPVVAPQEKGGVGQVLRKLLAKIKGWGGTWKST